MASMTEVHSATEHRSPLDCEERRKLARDLYNDNGAPTTAALQRLMSEHGIEVGRTSVYRYIVDGKTRYVRRDVPRLERRNMDDRLYWARLVASNRWLFNRLVWSDEKLFTFHRGNRGSKVLWTDNPSDPNRVRPQDGNNAVKMMLFGVYCQVRTTEGQVMTMGDACVVPYGSDGTVTGLVYQRVLRLFVQPFMDLIGPDYILLEDNASAHRACGHLVMPFRRVHHGTYPAHSPDFNAIERLWAHVQVAALAKVNRNPAIVDDTHALTQLLVQTFMERAHDPGPGKRIIKGTWENYCYAAAHDGEQNPHST